MCSYKINFFHKIAHQKWFQIDENLLRFYGFPFSLFFSFLSNGSRSISSVQYFSIKKLRWISAQVLCLMFGWIPDSPNSPDSQCDWLFFIDSLEIVLASQYVRFQSSNSRHHRNFPLNISVDNITYIPIVCCCGILLPNLVSTCGSLIGWIRSLFISLLVFFAFLLPWNLFPLDWN